MPGSDLSSLSCVKCSEPPAKNPCKLGEFWSLACNSTKDSGCTSCTGMVGKGVWTPSFNWTSPNCPYSCARGFYDASLGQRDANFARPNCTKCPLSGINGSRLCGLGSAFGQLP